MKKLLLPFVALMLFISCNKQETEIETTAASLSGNFVGDSWLWGPGSCTKGEGNQVIQLVGVNSEKITIIYIPHGNFPGFVPFPPVYANLVAKKNKVFYFMVEPLDNTECKVWQADTRTDNDVNYNIAVFPDGRIDARMSYYSHRFPQGNQYFDFRGRRQ